MTFKLNSLCLALSLGLSNYAIASCNGISGGASVYLEGPILIINGSSDSENYSLTSSADDLTVSRKVGSSSSCESFFVSQVRMIQAKLGNGNDSFDVKSIDVQQMIYGENGNDTLISGSQGDTIYGGAGHDTISGNGGHDRLLGEDGNDVIHGGAGNDQLSGGNHHDQLFGEGNGDVLMGDAGGDLLMGG